MRLLEAKKGLPHSRPQISSPRSTPKAVVPGANYLTSLGISFLTSKMEMIVAIPLLAERIKCLKSSLGNSQAVPGVGDGQGGLACCGSWDHKESDMTE